MTSKWITIPLLVALAAIASAGFIIGQEVQIEYRWTHPTTGTEVVKYQVEHSLRYVDGGEEVVLFIDDVPRGTDPQHGFYTVSYQYGATQKIRVRGVDGYDPPRAGPWSEWSLEWTDHGPPGQTGMPEQTLKKK